ncbi:response regulator [Microbispora siamensis]
MRWGCRRARSRRSSRGPGVYPVAFISLGAPPAGAGFVLAAMRSTGCVRDCGVMALRCLIVDDSDCFLQAARQLLETEGIAVVGVASTGADAAARCAGLRPDVVLVDIDLGEESGFEVTCRLADAAEDPPRVILISAHDGQDFMEMIETSPAIAFIPKQDLSGRAVTEIVQTAGGASPS